MNEIELIEYYQKTFNKDIYINEDVSIYVKIPNNLKFDNIKLNPNQIRDYYNSIKDDDDSGLRIRNINLSIWLGEENNLKCNYCNILQENYEYIYTCVECTYFMCLSCYEDKTREKCIQHDFTKLGMIKINDDDYLYNIDFGSMLDWIPIIIYEDNGFNAVLKNYNMDSKYYGKYALCISDNHCRVGYYTIDLNLDEIILKFNQYKQEAEKCKGLSWEEVEAMYSDKTYFDRLYCYNKYNEDSSLIYALATELDIQTEYG